MELEALKKMAGTKILPSFHFLRTFQGGGLKICQTSGWVAAWKRPGFLDSWRLNTQNDGSMVNVSLASNMAMFGIYVKFRVGTTLASRKNNKNLQSRLAKHTTWHHFAATNSLHTTLRSHTLNDLGLDIRLRGACWDLDVGLPAIELSEAIAIAMIKFLSVMTCDMFHIFSTHSEG